MSLLRTVRGVYKGLDMCFLLFFLSLSLSSVLSTQLLLQLQLQRAATASLLRRPHPPPLPFYRAEKTALDQGG